MFLYFLLHVSNCDAIKKMQPIYILITKNMLDELINKLNHQSLIENILFINLLNTTYYECVK